MKIGFGTFVVAAIMLGALIGSTGLKAAEPSGAKAVPKASLPDDSHFKSGEPIEADGFYRLQKDMEPNGISSGPAPACPYDEEAIGQPLLG